MALKEKKQQCTNIHSHFLIISFANTCHHLSIMLLMKSTRKLPRRGKACAGGARIGHSLFSSVGRLLARLDGGQSNFLEATFSLSAKSGSALRFDTLTLSQSQLVLMFSRASSETGQYHTSRAHKKGRRCSQCDPCPQAP